MERPASSTLPTTPGIYIYKDAQGRIIYVGKARNLRKRILSYFRDASALTPKTVAMIGHAASLETLSTTTEKEALLLEASLIKKHRPHYNIVLRDDKQYVLFRIAKDAPYPRLESCVRPGATTPAISAPSPRGRRPARHGRPSTGSSPYGAAWTGPSKPRPALPLPSYRAVSRAVHGNVPLKNTPPSYTAWNCSSPGAPVTLLDTLRHAMADASEP
mgnify:CR=1 FL=1